MFNIFKGEASWMSRRQLVVALSTAEEDYITTTHACKEVVWLKRLCYEIGFIQQPIGMYCDSQSAIFLANNIIPRQSTLMYNIIS